MKLTDSQLTRTIYSAWDFQQALSALTFLLEDCDYTQKYSRVQLRRFRCYETTLIISFSRPFEQSRNGTTLSLKALGIVLSSDEKSLVTKLLALRRKVIAHSDEEEMHFLAGSFPVSDGNLRFPQIQFSEQLEFSEAEAHKIETLLIKLKDGIASAIFEIAQLEPDRLEQRKSPSRAGG